jgi:ATP-dependent phosphofructokinase / diphosphate-dependent phosphofructokinase
MNIRTRIGILTGGGDCPGLNAVIRAVVLAAAQRGWSTLGILGGFEGLLTPVHTRELNPDEMDALLYLGGTVLGTSNRGRFSAKVGHGEVRQIDPAIIAEAKANAEKLGLRALVVVGGDGSLTIAQQCFEAGIPIIGVPKTIDNDIGGTVVTFGFDTAVSFATDALDRLRSTAQSHQRVMVCEMMGRYAGWIALHAGISGGADVILLPEIPFSMEAVCAKIRQRVADGKHDSLVVVAEGAREKDRDFVTVGQPAAGGGPSGGAFREARLGGVANAVAERIQADTGKETRVCVLGHLQRGGVPTTFDRLLCTRFGVGAVRLIAEENYGVMVAHRPPDTLGIPITEAIGKLRTVPTDCDVVRTARALGISFGDG